MRLNRPASRDDLAREVDPERQAEFISLLRTGTMKSKAALKKFLEVEKKGATKVDAYHESGELADKDTETGIFRNAAGQPVYQIADDKARIKTNASDHFDPMKGGRAPSAPLRDYMDHEELYSREPMLSMTPTVLDMPEVPADGQTWGGQGSYVTRGSKLAAVNYPQGRIHAQSRNTTRDPNARSPFSLLDTVLHEGQHGVADLQGMPGGDSPDNNFMQSEFGRLIHPRVAQYRDVLGTMKKRLMDEAGVTEEDWLQQFAEPDAYLKAANGLFVPAQGSKGKRSALPYLKRYESTSGETDSRRVSANAGKTINELREGPDYPWLPGADAVPYEFQLQRFGDRYEVADDKDTLVRLIQGKPLLSNSSGKKDPGLVQKLLGGAAGMFGLGGAASASEAEEAPQTPSAPRQMTKTTLPPEELKKKAEAYTAGFRSDKPYDPKDYGATGAEIAADTAKSATTSGRNVIEGTAGMGGYSQDTLGIAGMINDWFQTHTPSSIDQGPALKAAAENSYFKPSLPTQEQVHGVTESALGAVANPATKSFIDDWTEHEATTPWGSASSAVVDNLFDPTNAIPAAGKVKKGLKALRRFAP